MKLILILNLFFTISLFSQTEIVCFPLSKNICEKEFRMVWHDEFDSASLDLKVWDVAEQKNQTTQNLWDYVQQGPATEKNGCDFSKTASFSSKNVVLNPRPSDNNSGYLRLQIRKEPTEIRGFLDSNYQNNGKCTENLRAGEPFRLVTGFTSGSISTREIRVDLVETEAVKIEARCRIPKNIQGTWPSFWLWNHKEIDIFEFFGKNTTFASTIHSEPIGGRKKMMKSKKHKFRGVDFTDWHTYGMVWTRFDVKFYFDGRLIREVRGLEDENGRKIGLGACGERVPAGCYRFVEGFPNGKLDPAVFPVGENGELHTNWMTIIFGSGIFKSSKMLDDSAAYPINFDVDWVRLFKRN